MTIPDGEDAPVAGDRLGPGAPAQHNAAVQALSLGGTIVVSTEVQGEQVVLKVADNGVGMSEEVRQRWLEPFFTTRRPLAAGLGLNRVYHIVLRHRGDLQIESAEGQGTRVIISLPVGSPT